MKHRILIIICLSIFATSDAQTIQKISIQDAINLSIKNSNSLKISSTKVTNAAADVQEAKDRQLPNVNVSGSYLRLAGADFKLKSANGNNAGPKVNQALYAIVNASLPIYAAGKIKYGIEAAKYVEEAAKLSVENDKESIAYNAVSAYVNLYKANAVVSVLKETLKASQQRDATFGRLEQNGLLARNDLLKSQLQTSNIELSLLDAENNFNLATINMALLIGLPENTSIEIDSNFINEKIAIKPFSAYEMQALQNRKDIKVIDIQKKAAAIGVKAAKTDAYPTLALTGGYINADIPKILSITNALNIGIAVRYDIATLWKKNTKLDKAKTVVIQLNATKNLLEDGIRLQINKDYQNYILAQKKIEVFDKAIAQATENERITKNKFDNSLVTITEWLDANVMLLQTKLNAAAAKADASLAYNKILETTGNLIKE